MHVHTLRMTHCDRGGPSKMFKASAGKTLPTSIIGSLPRPSWYTAVLGAKSFLQAMLPDLPAATAVDSYYKDPVERTMALSEALNKELNDLADAGCPVIQMEEPQIHMVPIRGKAFGKLDVQDLVGVFNNTVKGLRT